MSDKNEFAPSEEYSLHCDARGCEAGLSMLSEIPRQWHGWGRISLYSDVGGDMDLCPTHLKAIWAVLGATENSFAETCPHCPHPPAEHAWLHVGQKCNHPGCDCPGLEES
jgi:hypothetical protein